MDKKQDTYTNNQTPILIIGGGIAGLTAAVEAAETGYRVILIEKQPYLGGRVAQLNRYFPKMCPPYCGLEINFRRIRTNPRITVYISTTVTNISGEPGNFSVTLLTEPQYINNKCTSCGECVKVCPVERPDEFNQGMTTTRTAYLPHELAYPFRYVIDHQKCKGVSCGLCLDACDYQAINLSATETKKVVKAGTIILTTGWKPYDPMNLQDLGYGKSPDIITGMMMERLGAPNGPTHGQILRLSDNEIPKKIAFIQCAGSRDENNLPYCSGVCCSATLKQAMHYVEQNPEGEATIFYIDLRVTGRNEDFLSKIIDHPRINLIKSKVATVQMSSDKHTINLDYEDILSGLKQKSAFDMVILATGIIPENIDPIKISADDFGFAKSEHLPDGFYSAGCLNKPADVASSIKESTGITLKALRTAGFKP
ncbi:MAG: heterodisulfide reductase subunit A [Bacteroides sp. SM23_62_1]|nr:MAG: heterodisulfide reductase subunit A [Bacteroides sp. SM23_62_1]